MVATSYALAPDGSVGFRLGDYDPTQPLVIDPTITYSTAFGGAVYDEPQDIALDSTGAAYIVGSTQSIDYPQSQSGLISSAGSTNAFLTKLGSDGRIPLYSVLIGGTSSDYGQGVKLDGQGNIYIVGYTLSNDFPTPSGYDTSYGGDKDAFLVKLRAPTTSVELLYGSFYGGAASERDLDLAIDASGALFLAGTTGSCQPVLFVTAQVYDQFCGGDELFVVKFNSDFTRSYGTFIGGSSDETAGGIAIDSAGNAYIVGTTVSTDVPGINGKQGTNNGSADVLVVKLNADATAATYATYLGGSEYDAGLTIAVAGANAYVGGRTFSSEALFPITSAAYDRSNDGNYDGFVTKLSADGKNWDFSTYLGGSAYDIVQDLAVDASGMVYATGRTDSGPLFPVKDPAFAFAGFADAFVVQLNPTGSTVNYATPLGGQGTEQGNGIATDSSGNVYVTGYTIRQYFAAENFPTTPGTAFYASNASNNLDVFVVKLNNQAVLPQPANASYNDYNWTVSASVSADDGLVVQNATLGTRLLAPLISLPYVQLQTSAFGSQRFELKPNGASPGRSRLIGYWAARELFEGDRPRLVVQANYRLDSFPNSSQSTLFVTQRFEFHEEVPENFGGMTPEQYACEPSEDNPLTAPFAQFTCARWKPIYSYSFLGRGGETLSSLGMPERLHFTPDGEPLRGNAVIHDCNNGESGTLAEPCWITDPSTVATDIYPVPRIENPGEPNPIIRNDPTFLPGIKLLDNTATLGHEVLIEAIKNGINVNWYTGLPNDLSKPQQGTWDNLHLSRNAFVDLPVPLPPGCAECVHIHWRWAQYFNAKFGDGPPQLEGPPGRAGFVMIPRRAAPTPSNQTVHVALAKYRLGEDDPTDAWALANNEPLTQNDGVVVWYLATGYQASDTFFAHGGFFSPLTGVAPTDIAVALTPATATAAVDSTVSYTVSVSKVDPQPIDPNTEVNFYILMPETLVNPTTVEARPTSLLYPASCTKYHMSMIKCTASASLLVFAGVSVTAKATVAGPLTVKAYAVIVNKDTNFANNRAEATTTITGPSASPTAISTPTRTATPTATTVVTACQQASIPAGSPGQWDSLTNGGIANATGWRWRRASGSGNLARWTGSSWQFVAGLPYQPNTYYTAGDTRVSPYNTSTSFVVEYCPPAGPAPTVTATRTATPVAASATPTRTPTAIGASATATRTPTAAASTATATRTATPSVPTNTPTSATCQQVTIPAGSPGQWDSLTNGGIANATGWRWRRASGSGNLARWTGSSWQFVAGLPYQANTYYTAVDARVSPYNTSASFIVQYCPPL